MPYTDFHRALAQAFLARPTMTAKDAKKVVQAAIKVEAGLDEEVDAVNDAMLNEYIAQVNEELTKFDFEIRSMRDQNDRSTIFAFVNSTPDPIIQGATHHTADEIAFFRRLLDAMFETNNTRRAEVFAVRSHDAIHLNKNPPREAGNDEALPEGTQAVHSHGLTLKEAESALVSFVAEGWLQKSRNNWYSLAPRGLMELAVYLTQTYNSDDEEESDGSENAAPRRKRIKKCEACSELLTVGQRCSNLDCEVRLHEPCSVQFFRVNRDKRCPQCKTAWSGTELVGEGAAEKLLKRVQSRGGIPSPQQPAQMRKNSRRQQQEEEEEDENMEDGEAEGQGRA